MGSQNNLLQVLPNPKLNSLEGGTVTSELRRFTMQNIQQSLLISYSTPWAELYLVDSVDLLIRSSKQGS